MLESDPKDSELQALRATYLARSENFDEASKYAKQLIGYDPKTDKFDVKKASAPHDPQVYATLAAIVRSKESKPELAERIMDQAVAVNPKSAEALVQRGQLRSAWGNSDGARADAEAAYKLKPEDTAVLLFMCRPGCRGQRVRQGPRVPRRRRRSCTQTTFSSISEPLCWRSGNRSPRKAIPSSITTKPWPRSKRA